MMETGEHMFKKYVVVLILFAVWGVGCKKSKPQIERIESPRLHENGSPSKAVEYIDRRDGNNIIQYLDEEADGHVDRVTYEVNGKQSLAIYLSKTEAHASLLNANQISGGTKTVPSVYFWSKSKEGQILDQKYRNIIFAYQGLNPGKKLSEREVRPMWARPQLVQEFGQWVDEYLAQGKKMSKNRPGREGEIEEYRWWLAEGYMVSAYKKLNDRERDSLFDWDHGLCDQALGIGRKVGEIFRHKNGEWRRWPRNPRDQFEERMRGPHEVDFMSAMSISKEFDKHRLAYESELRRRGFTF